MFRLRHWRNLCFMPIDETKTAGSSHKPVYLSAAGLLSAAAAVFFFILSGFSSAQSQTPLLL